MDIIMKVVGKHLIRQLLGYLATISKATATTLDDQLYDVGRAWALEKGYIDADGNGVDDPGPERPGGGDGGPTAAQG